MATKIETKPLVGRDSDGIMRGGRARVPSLAADDAPAAADAKDAGETVSNDHPRRSAVHGDGSLIVPLGDVNPTGNAPRNINVRLERSQAITLRRLRSGLEDSGARLNNGSEVTDNAKVIRWLLEQIAKQ